MNGRVGHLIGVGAVFCLASFAAFASNLDLTVTSNGGSGVCVQAGAIVNYEVRGLLGDANNEGLAGVAFDLVFDGGDLAPADEPTSGNMTNFIAPAGLSNPTGYGGSASGDRLVQIGGAQNTIGHTGTYPNGSVITGVGQTEQILVTGSLTAPSSEGTYTLTPSKLLASVIVQGETGAGGYWATELAGTGIQTPLTIDVRATCDCQPNGILDACDIDCGPAGGSCDVPGCGQGQDCNGNNVPDECDLTAGTSEDCNANGIPDECSGAGDTPPVVYEVHLSDLLNVSSTCTATPESKYGCSTQAGFQWTDTGSGSANSVQIEFNVGIECHTVGTTHNTSLNGIPDASYVTAANWCSCSDTAGSTMTIDFDTDSYSVGGTNTFAITNSTTCLGFIPQDAWGSGIYARVTVVYGEAPDCNTNGVPDDCDITAGTSTDCNSNGIPDECETDCQPNGVPDDCDISAGTSQDCNDNGIPDECDIASGPSNDCNSNTVPDECDLESGSSEDCNDNVIPDECDIAGGSSTDCEPDGVPDECEPDCNLNFVADACDVSSGTSQDCNGNGIPDECTGSFFAVYDVPLENLVNMTYSCGNGSYYGYNQPRGFHWEDTGTAPPRSVQVTFNVGVECHTNGTIHNTTLNGQPDASYNSVPLYCSCTPSAGVNVSLDLDPENYIAGDLNTLIISSGSSSYGLLPDTDWGSGIYARVTVEYGYEEDCNSDGTPDECQVPPIDPAGTDCNGNLVPDECEADCQPNGVADACDISSGSSTDCNGNGIPDDCDIASGTSMDCNANGLPDECTAPAVATIDILESDLLNMVYDFCPPGWFNCGEGYPGFQWTGPVGAEVTEVQIEFNVGLECNATGSTRDSIWNGLAGPSYTVSQAYCDCTATDGIVETANVDPADYNPSGTNTFHIVNTIESCLGFTPNSDWGAGVYARVTVTYVPEADCNSNGTPDDCDISAGTSDDCDADGIPDECQISNEVLDAVERGWWNSAGSHSSTNNNTLTGKSGSIYNSYFIFDVSSQSGSTGSALLRLELENYYGTDASESVTVYDVSTDAAILEATGTDVSIFQDLQSGNSYASFIVTPADIGTMLEIPLNAQAAADINDGGQFFAVGLHVTTIGASSMEAVRFSAGSEARVHQLDLDGPGDCNGNDVLDACDIIDGTSQDCDANGIPDECDPDCQPNGTPDGCDIVGGTSQDCDSNGVPDECDPDCQPNGVPDACDISAGTSSDCDANDVPDECEPDCQPNGVADACDVSGGTSQDCNGNTIPDECESLAAITYEIHSADLINFSSSCSAGYYGNSNPGFTWEDEGCGVATDVQIEFNVGVECHSAGTTHTTNLNGAADASFSATPNYCLCTATPGVIVNLDVDEANYVTGATNTFTVDNLSTWFGVTEQSTWGTGVYARVTVTYAP